ncbi:Uncharacterised protein g4446 [Pycnogonum litorale]
MVQMRAVVATSILLLVVLLVNGSSSARQQLSKKSTINEVRKSLASILAALNKQAIAIDKLEKRVRSMFEVQKKLRKPTSTVNLVIKYFHDDRWLAIFMLSVLCVATAITTFSSIHLRLVIIRGREICEGEVETPKKIIVMSL